MPQNNYTNQGVPALQSSVAATLIDVQKDVITIDVRGMTRIFVQLTVAVAALTGFAVKATPNANVLTASAAVLANTAGAFTTPKDPIIGASGDLTTLGIGTGWVVINTVGMQTITINATSAGTATLAVDIGGSN